jgi:uncharacterized BrkB/YihY/UPF0761 family membrane protein
MPYFFVFLLAMTILVLSIITLWVQGLAYGVHLFAGHEVPISRIMLYGLGLSVELASFSLIYWIVPVGGTKGSHALLGGAIATAAWEILRHLLLWYLTTMSNASIVYGSLTTAVVAMLSMEAAATVLLIGAQAIAEYEIQGINRDAQPIP